MSTSLLDLSKLTSHAQLFTQAATGLGFGAVGDIDRFVFQSYGKAIREIPYANRPKGALLFLAPPGTASALVRPGDLKPVLLQIQADVARRFYQVPMDLAGGAIVAHSPTSAEQRMMAAGAWPLSAAQAISRAASRCVLWGNGVGAAVCLNGDIYLETPDVIEELPTGMPASFQSLSWDDGRVVYEYAENELNDTSAVGIWRLADKFLLRPKPEKIMSTGLGKFLRLRLAGYKHHEDEAHVENEGRSDLSLTIYNGSIYIIEVKWIGRSLVATKELQTEQAIKSALNGGTSGWVTEFDDTTFIAGAKQLARYFKTGKYQRAYLTVFDCCAPKNGRKHESPAIAPTHVAPYNCASFRALRACVDPRKASKSSKAKSP